MEDDRLQVDVGMAVDIEEKQEETAAQRQPKKRFVGRRQAAEAASRNGSNGNVEDGSAIQGDLSPFLIVCPLKERSCNSKENAANLESSPF
jgi:hypothetical protein